MGSPHWFTAIRATGNAARLFLWFAGGTAKLKRQSGMKTDTLAFLFCRRMAKAVVNGERKAFAKTQSATVNELQWDAVTPQPDMNE